MLKQQKHRAYSNERKRRCETKILETEQKLYKIKEMKDWRKKNNALTQ